MWVRKTADETKISARESRVASLKISIIVGALCGVLFTIFDPLYKLYLRDPFVPADEWAERFPSSLALGLIVAFVYAYRDSQRTFVICRRCNRTKVQDRFKSCIVCGGTFEPLDEFKWVENDEIDSALDSEKMNCLSCNSVILKTDKLCPYCQWPNKYKYPNQSSELM
jgi:ribosomal protein L37E